MYLVRSNIKTISTRTGLKKKSYILYEGDGYYYVFILLSSIYHKIIIEACAVLHYFVDTKLFRITCLLHRKYK